jgi:hypothetical protein
MLGFGLPGNQGKPQVDEDFANEINDKIAKCLKKIQIFKDQYE